jgi:uncharacterized damage-inducible protein DinB
MDPKGNKLCSAAKAPERITEMTALYKADDRDLLTGVLSGESVHLDPAAILDGLTDEQARTRPHDLPYSIADLVGHICYWQEWFNACVTSGFTGIAKHSVDGWPGVEAGGWDALRVRYLNSIQEARRLVAESKSLADSLLPSGAGIPSLARESHGSGLLRAAVHNSHHLGQIITLRRLMGLWPPPGGTITW